MTPGHARTIDGRLLDTSSEDWRLYTEARYVLAMPFGKRRPWLDGADIMRSPGRKLDPDAPLPTQALRSEIIRLSRLANVVPEPAEEAAP